MELSRAKLRLAVFGPATAANPAIPSGLIIHGPHWSGPTALSRLDQDARRHIRHGGPPNHPEGGHQTSTGPCVLYDVCPTAPRQRGHRGIGQHADASLVHGSIHPLDDPGPPSAGRPLEQAVPAALRQHGHLSYTLALPTSKYGGPRLAQALHLHQHP